MIQQTSHCLSSLCIDAFFLGPQHTILSSPALTLMHFSLIMFVVRFLGTSGQNISDVDKYSDAKDTLEFMERTLRWRHLTPTAPNTLGCYPYTDKDPFLIESFPHVYFAGNQDRYETRLLNGSEGRQVRLVCIPKFSETGTAVVLNLRDLECHALSFGTQFSP